MKIALAQLNFSVGDIEQNKIKIIDSICTARGDGAQLVIFAEFAISGCPCYDVYNKLPFLEACEEALVEIASYCDDIAVIVGLPLQADNGRVVSGAAYIKNRRVIKYIGKKSVVSRDEMGFISPSNGSEVIQLKDRKIAVLVGQDLLTEWDFPKNADFVVSLYADPYARAVIQARYNYFKSFAFKAGKPVAFVNHLGGSGDIVYDGSSCVITGDGKPAALLANFQEEVLTIDIDNATEVSEPEQDKTVNVYKAIKLGLGDYFKKGRFAKACVGVSGGIDSAVVAALAAEVLGPGNVRALLMPSQFSSDHSVKDGIALCDNLGIEYDVVPITESYKALTETMLPVLGGTSFDYTEENIQARLRTVMLMALSNKFGYILLNTGNKSENAVGFSTLYGDMAGAIGIIGDLYKAEVYDLARYLNRDREIIPENILRKEPSAELRPDQKDSDTLPPYDILDAILYRFIEEGQTIEEIGNAGFDDQTVRMVLEKIKTSEHKRRQGCPVLRLSTRPFDNAFVLPVINRFIL